MSGKKEEFSGAKPESSGTQVRIKERCWPNWLTADLQKNEPSEVLKCFKVMKKGFTWTEPKRQRKLAWLRPQFDLGDTNELPHKGNVYAYSPRKKGVL